MANDIDTGKNLLNGFMQSVGAGSTGQVNPACVPKVITNVPSKKDAYGRKDNGKQKPPKHPK